MMTEFSDLDWPALFFLRTLEIYVLLQKANAIRVECYLEPGNSNLKVRKNEKQKPNTGRPCSLTQAVETGSFRVLGGSVEKAGPGRQAVVCITCNLTPRGLSLSTEAQAMLATESKRCRPRLFRPGC